VCLDYVAGLFVEGCTFDVFDDCFYDVHVGVDVDDGCCDHDDGCCFFDVDDGCCDHDDGCCFFDVDDGCCDHDDVVCWFYDDVSCFAGIGWGCGVSW